MYTFESRVRYSELDAEGKLSIGSVVDYFQDCSTFQSESLGVGLEYLKQLGMVWVMSYWQIVIGEYPGLGDEILVGTYPYEFKSFMGFRNFLMQDASGRRIIWANSVWTLMDMAKGRPARPTEEMLAAYQMEPKLEMEYEPRKIQLPDQLVSQAAFRVGKQHLDSNHHVNNGQYIYMAQEYVPEDFAIGQLRAEYKKSALLGDLIEPRVCMQKDQISVSLEDGEGHPFAVVEFRRKSA